ncbi:hypothetical protein ACHAPJ_002126 [Fusarium lateritium]
MSEPTTGVILSQSALDQIEDAMRAAIENFFDKFNDRNSIGKINKRCDNIDKNSLDRIFDEINGRLDKIDKRLGQLLEKIDKTSASIDTMISQQGSQTLPKQAI